MNSQLWHWKQKPPLGTLLDPDWVAETGCVAFWALNEGSGTRINDYVGGATMMYTGAASPQTQWKSGPAGHTLAFNGSSQYTTAASRTGLAPPQTWFGRFSCANAGGFAALLGWTAAGNNGVRTEVVTNGLALVFGGVAVYSLTGFTIFSNVWYSYAVTLDKNGGTARGYIFDGKNLTTLGTATVGTYSGTPTQWSLGIRGDVSDVFSGQMEYAGVCNRAMPAAEVGNVLANPYAGFLAPATRRWFVWGVTAGSTAYTRSSPGSLTAAGTLALRTSKALAGSATPASVAVRAAAKSLTGSSTPAGVQAKSARKTLTGSLTGTGAAVRLTAKPLAGSTAATGAAARQTTKPLTGSSTATSSATRAARKTLAGSSAPTGTIARLRTACLALAGSLTPTGLVGRAAAKGLAGSLAAVGVAVKACRRWFAGGLTPAGSASAAKLSSAAPRFVLRASRASPPVLAASRASPVQILAGSAMSVDNQTFTLTVGEDLTLAFDLATGQAAPSAAVFTLTDGPLGTPFPGFPLSVAGGGVVVQPTGGAGGGVRLVVTIPHAVTAQAPNTPRPAFTLWDTSSGAWTPLANGTAVIRQPAGLPG